MTTVSVRFKDKEVRRMIRRLKRRAPRAISRGINKLSTQARTAAGREIRQSHRKLKAKAVRASLPVTRSNPRTLSAKIIGLRRTHPLENYNARLAGGKNSKRVQVEVTPGRRKHLASARFGRDGRVLMKVNGRVRRLYGPSVGTALTKKSTVAAVRRTVNEKGPRLIIHELRREIRRT